MIEIELPCCDAAVLVSSLDGPVRCDACGIELEPAAELDPAPERLAAA